MKKGFAFIIADNVPHAELVLEKDIPLDYSKEDGPKEPPKANPDFNWMMDSALRFFKHQVVNL